MVNATALRWEDDHDVAEPSLPEDEGSPLERFVPYSMQQGFGLQVAVSLHRSTTDLEGVRTAVSLDTLHRVDDHIPYIHSDVIELLKALRRRGAELEIPSAAAIVTTKDWYKTFPLVAHSLAATAEDVSVTFDAILDVVTAWNNRDLDLYATFSVAVTLGETELRVSIVGHSQEIERWLKDPLSRPPSDLATAKEWSESVASYLSVAYAPAPAEPAILEILMNSGVFRFQRRFVDQDVFNVEFLNVEDGLTYMIEIPFSQRAVGEALQQEILHLTMQFSVEKSTCSLCGQEYQECEHSKVLDSGVVEEIKDTRHAALFWADRPVT